MICLLRDDRPLHLVSSQSTENLSLAGGSEVSRKTLDYLKAQAQEEQEETNGEQKEPSAEETGPNELPPVDEGAEEAEDGDGDVEGGVEDGEGAGESKDKEEPKEEAAPAPASTPAE